MKKIGQFKIYRKMQRLTCFLGYQSPKHLSFFEFIIMNALVNYPDRSISLQTVLTDVLQQNDLYLYERAIKELVEKYRLVKINTNHHDNLNHDRSSWLAYALTSYKISPENVTAFENDCLTMSGEKGEWKLEVQYDSVLDRIVFSQSKDFAQFDKPVGELILGDDAKTHYDVKNLLEFCSNNRLQINAQFNEMMIFEYIRIGVDKLHNDFALSDFFVDCYQPLIVNVELDDHQKLVLIIDNDAELSIWLEHNVELYEQLKDYYLAFLKEANNQLLTKDVLIKDEDVIAGDVFALQNVSITIDDPYGLIINCDQVNADWALKTQWGVTKRLKFILFVNALDCDSLVMQSEFAETVLIYVTKEMMPIASDFLACYFNHRHQLQTLEARAVMFSYKAGRIAFAFSDDSLLSNSKILVEILNKLQEWYDQLIFSFANKNKLFLYERVGVVIYLCSMITNSHQHFDHFMATIEKADVKDKTPLYLNVLKVFKRLKMPEGLSDQIFIRLVKSIQQNIKSDDNVLDWYRVLKEYGVFSETMMVKILTGSFASTSITLNQIFDLSRLMTEDMLAKMWQSNAFDCVKRTLSGLLDGSTKNAVERFGYLDQYPRCTLLLHLMNYVKYYLEQERFLELHRYDKVQMRLKEWWINISALINQLVNVKESGPLVLRVWQSYSEIERIFCLLKFSEMSYGDDYFKEYCNRCEFAKAWYLLQHRMMIHIDAIYEKIGGQGYDYVNEQLYVLGIMLSDRKKFEQISDLYYKIRANAFFDEWREERNSNKVREQLYDFSTQIKEMFNDESF